MVCVAAPQGDMAADLAGIAFGGIKRWISQMLSVHFYLIGHCLTFIDQRVPQLGHLLVGRGGHFGEEALDELHHALPVAAAEPTEHVLGARPEVDGPRRDSDEHLDVICESRWNQQQWSLRLSDLMRATPHVVKRQSQQSHCRAGEGQAG
jgi:hypothetical protein